MELRLDRLLEVFGPSIYTVNEQYIKPVTKRAGKMSWALMRNPKGYMACRGRT